jgi:hypothetical protein
VAKGFFRKERSLRKVEVEEDLLRMEQPLRMVEEEEEEEEEGHLRWERALRDELDQKTVETLDRNADT